MKKINVYIDGFNFYYGNVKNTKLKWLDFKLLIQNMLKEVKSLNNYEIRAIKYFTALITGRGDVNRPKRQLNYISALETHLPEFRVYYGQYKSEIITRPLVTPLNNIRYVDVRNSNEKGSDVALALHMLNDAYVHDSYDIAILLSNDSDFSSLVDMVRTINNKEVWLFLPHKCLLSRTHIEKCYPSVELIKRVNYIKTIKKRHLIDSQLPDKIPASNRYIEKPLEWR